MSERSSAERKTKHYAQMNAGILDKEAREQFSFPAQYMFKDVPDYGDVDEPVELLLAEMDRFNVAHGMLTSHSRYEVPSSDPPVSLCARSMY